MPEKTLQAVAAGHLCLDVRHPSFQRQQEIVDLLQPGMEYDPNTTLQTIENPLNPDSQEEVAKFLAEASRSANGLLTGGGVSNTGIPLWYLLKEVKLMAKVGKDPFGKAIRSVLQGTHQLPDDVVLLKEVEGETTSYTIVMNNGSGHSMYAHYPGTNNTFTPADIDMSVVAQARAFEFSYPTLMKHYYTHNHALAYMCEAVSMEDTLIYLDMHDLHEDEPSGQADWITILGNALPFIHRFCPSLNEALYICNRKLLRQYDGDAHTQKKDITEIIGRDLPGLLEDITDYYLDMGTNGVLLKCGREGLHLKTRVHRKDGIDGIHARAYDVPKKVDTTGAGDNTIAAFMMAELQRYDPRECLLFGNAAGALNVQYQGSVGAFRKKEDLTAVMHANR